MLFKKMLCTVMALLVCALTVGSYISYADSVLDRITSLEDFAEKCPMYDLESLADPQEFVNYEEYLNYLQEEYEEYVSGLSGGDLNIGEGDPDDLLANNTPVYGFNSQTATPVYKVMNLPVDSVIQKCYVTNQNIYTVQVVEGSNSDDIYLSRCTISNDNIHAYHQTHMILKDFGHNQTLEMFSYNKHTYCWIGLKPYSVSGEDYEYTTQIGRIRYQGGTTINSYTQVPRLGNLNYANYSNGTSTNFGTVKRAEAALSTNGNQLLISVRNDPEQDNTDDKVQYSIYSTSVINQLLDAVETNPNTNLVSFKNNPTLQGGFVLSFTQVGNQRIFPNGNSCQGLELTNNTYSIYMASGYCKSGHRPRIGKMVNTGTVDYPNYIYHSYLKLTNSEMQFNSNNNYSQYTEIEGVQIKGEYLYFVLTHINENTLIQNYSSFNFPNDSSTTDPQYVYRIEKSAVHGGSTS